MISVIICSINKVFANRVQKNIAETIGVAWESIIIDNTLSPQSITAVYNQGAAKANYDTLCFVHEDVLFQTTGWGLRIASAFNQDERLGLIGVAGSKYKSKTPSGWYTGFTELDCGNITHLNQDGKNEKLYFNPEPGTTAQEVVTVDGVFMCCPKKVWEDVKFDEVVLKDFHLYDLDFSVRVAEKYKVIVTFEIDIIHITKGAHYGNRWLESTLIWHRYMQKKLPAGTPDYNVYCHKFENKILKTWLIRLKHEQLSLSNKLHWLYQIKIWAHIAAWPFIVLFLFKTNASKKLV